MDEFNREEIRAMESLGKYRFAEEYQIFAVDHATWNKWGKERRIEWVNLFRQYSPSAFDAYEKSKNAGLKTTPRTNKRRVWLPEPELLEQRVEVPWKLKADAPWNVSPILLNKGVCKSWQVLIAIPGHFYSKCSPLNVRWYLSVAESFLRIETMFEQVSCREICDRKFRGLKYLFLRVRVK